MNALLIVGAVIVLLIMVVAGIYNGLVRGKNHFKNAFAQIDVQLKRRYDLIPNLVETAKGYLSHEKETLQAVVEARNAAVSAIKAASADPGNMGAIQALGQADSLLTKALGGLNVAIEAYPDLKGSETMQTLMEELTSTENRVAFSRQAFNDAVMSYNITREKFPNVLFAQSFGFSPAQQLDLELSAEAKEAPKVSF